MKRTIQHLLSAPSALSWQATRWQQVGSVVVASPRLYYEIARDPGLENAYTDGLCITLDTGSNLTFAEAEGRSGKGQQFTPTGVATGLALKAATAAALVSRWYRWVTWGKRTASGESRARLRLWGTATGSVFSADFTSEEWARVACCVRPLAQERLYPYGVNCNPYSTSGDTVVIDDISYGPMMWEDLVNVRDLVSASARISADLTVPGGLSAGVVWRHTDEANQVISYLSAPNGTGGSLTSVEYVAGVPNALSTDSVIYAAGSTLEVNTETGVVSYAGAPIHTVSPNAALTGTKVGLFSTDSSIRLENVVAVRL